MLSVFCLPQIYRNSTKKHGFLWFLEADVIRCFSTFDAQKARKIGQKRERKTTKEIKALQQFTNLKSLGVKPVPVQVRLAAPEIIVKSGLFWSPILFFCPFIYQSVTFLLFLHVISRIRASYTLAFRSGRPFDSSATEDIGDRISWVNLRVEIQVTVKISGSSLAK